MPGILTMKETSRRNILRGIAAGSVAITGAWGTVLADDRRDRSRGDEEDKCTRRWWSRDGNPCDDEDDENGDDVDDPDDPDNGEDENGNGDGEDGNGEDGNGEDGNGDEEDGDEEDGDNGRGGNGAGGSGFLTDAGLDRLGWEGNELDVLYREDDVWLKDAACQGQGKDYIAYRVTDGDTDAGLFVNPNRQLNTGTTVVLTKVTENCGDGILEHGPFGFSERRDISRVAFGTSVRSGNGR